MSLVTTMDARYQPFPTDSTLADTNVNPTPLPTFTLVAATVPLVVKIAAFPLVVPLVKARTTVLVPLAFL